MCGACYLLEQQRQMLEPTQRTENNTETNTETKQSSQEIKQQPTTQTHTLTSPSKQANKKTSTTTVASNTKPFTTSTTTTPTTITAIDCVNRQFNRATSRKFNFRKLREKCLFALCKDPNVPSDASQASQDRHLTTLNLNLSDLELNDRHSTGLSKLLSNSILQTRVTALNISDNRFLVPGARKISVAIQNMKSLNTLNISGNRSLGPVGCASIADAALISGIVSLSMRDVSLSQFHFDLGCKQISVLLCTSTKLEYIDLSFNCLRTAQFAIICNGIKNRTMQSNLTQLVLSGNPLGDEGVTMLVHAIRSMQQSDSKLRILSVDQCNIQTNGTKALAALIRDGFLDALYMNQNKIGIEGAQAIGNALEPCFGLVCGVRGASGKNKIQRAIVPPAPYQCFCSNIKKIMAINCISNHDFHQEQLGQSFIISSLMARNKWINGSLKSLMFCIEKPNRTINSIINYNALPKDIIWTFLMAMHCNNFFCPVELIWYILQWVSTVEMRSVIVYDVTVH